MLGRFFFWVAVIGFSGIAAGGSDPLLPLVPKKNMQLFNGKDFTGLTAWLRDSKDKDPRKVFTVHDGIIHVSGDGFGYLATANEWRDYHLLVEYKWGRRTDGGKYVRNSGILLHAVGPDGGAGKGAWMSCIECQLAQGCVGDFIVIRGKDKAGKVIPVTLTSDTVKGPDGRTRWKKGGQKTAYAGKQFWWSLHDPDFKELLDTRGKNDVESKLGDWTKVECICAGKRITVIVNGITVNECYDVYPAAGKILLQSEGFEIFFRRFELQPLQQ
jgi:hypothetical protein